MTYTSETNLSSTSTEAETSTVDKLKTLKQEGTERTQRIFKILHQALSETREEFQAGRTVISPLAKEVTTEAVSTVKEKSQQAAEAVNQAWKDEASAPDTTERLINLIKRLFKTTKTTVFPTVEQQARTQAIKLDELLSKRYGEQYTTVKNRFELIRSWVSPKETVEPETANSEPTIVVEVDSTPIH
ncbi:MAG: hypothetical protein ACFB16_13730 [Phormidesmis sp.]